MALNEAGRNAAANGFAAAYPYLSLHTTGDVTSSANESTAGRVAADWSSASESEVEATGVAFTGGASSGPAVRVGYWSAAEGGTYGGGAMITGDQAFNAAGEFTLTSVTETASAA